MDAIEISRLNECEAVIERGMKTFVYVGNALLEIRESKLYREAFGTFEDYCRGKWGFNRTYSFYMIEAAKVVANISVHNCERLPQTESQTRPLIALEPAHSIYRHTSIRILLPHRCANTTASPGDGAFCCYNKFRCRKSWSNSNRAPCGSVPQRRGPAHFIRAPEPTPPAPSHAAPESVPACPRSAQSRPGASG